MGRPERRATIESVIAMSAVPPPFSFPNSRQNGGGYASKNFQNVLSVGVSILPANVATVPKNRQQKS